MTNVRGLNHAPRPSDPGKLADGQQDATATDDHDPHGGHAPSGLAAKRHARPCLAVGNADARGRAVDAVPLRRAGIHRFEGLVARPKQRRSSRTPPGKNSYPPGRASAAGNQKPGAGVGNHRRLGNLRMLPDADRGPTVGDISTRRPVGCALGPFCPSTHGQPALARRLAPDSAPGFRRRPSEKEVWQG